MAGRLGTAAVLLAAAWCVSNGGRVAAEVTGNKTSDLVATELERCGEVIDAHLHIAPWFSTAEELMAELAAANVSRGVLYSVYGRAAFSPIDPNEEVSGIAQDSGGDIVGLASLNTTGSWTKDGEAELQRLALALEADEFAGAKLAPPHTCLPLNGDILRDVVATVAKSPSPVLAIHTGTTPFCGPLGAAFGPALLACCSREYVDPALLDGLLADFPNVTFLLLHSGLDFLPPGDELHYNGQLVDAAIALTAARPNALLEISALHAQHPNGTFKYPGGDEAVKRIAEAGLAGRVVWGSDANHNKGNVGPNLASGVEAMIKAGFTPEERCAALVGWSKELFFSHLADEGGQTNMSLPWGGNSTDSYGTRSRHLGRSPVSAAVAMLVLLSAFGVSLAL